MASGLNIVQPYTKCSSSDISSNIIVLPSRAYVEELVTRLEEFEVKSRVEGIDPYFTVTGKYKVIDLTIGSTGIGAPSLALLVEEYSRLGGRVFIKVGYATAIDPRLSIGDIIIASAAVRADGTSKHYAPIEYPAYASYDLIWYTMDILRTYSRIYDHEIKYYTAPVLSVDIISNIDEIVQKWSKTRVAAIDMETSTLYTMSSLKMLKSLSVLVINSSIPHGIMPGDLERASERNVQAKKVKERLLEASRLVAEILVRIREEYRYQRELEERSRGHS